MPPLPPRETRSVAARIAPSADGKTLTGYAAVWDAPTEISEYGFRFTEVVRRGAFARALAAAGADVLCAVNHDPLEHLLGRSASGTATFAEDDHGLTFAVSLPDTEAGREARELARRGDLVGASFMFSVPPGGDRWVNPSFRELLDVDLYEAGPVVTPAYAATSLALRARAAAAPPAAPPAGPPAGTPLDTLRRRLALVLKPRG